MTAIGGYVAPTASSDEFGIHSLDQFVLAVPDVNAADEFYTNFGLNMVRKGNTLQLKTFGHDHAWGSVVEGKTKALHHLSFGCYAEDIDRLKKRIEGQGIKLIDPPPGFESNGFWFRNHEGILMEVKVAPKVSPDQKAVSEWVTVGHGQAAATTRAAAPLVRPRRLSHVLIFTSDVLKSIEFYERTLGLRLSDRASDLVAFMHGIHGSDHHLLALVKSSAPGFHHCSWDMASINDIGLGAARMHDKGYQKGWGLGRHVLGSNYFHYIMDPWGSFAEYSCDIDYISKEDRWPSADHKPEDSFYLWGPEVPREFTINREAGEA
ncbi:VOC family protein [Pseudolabrys sp. FHR47]|uniref:VOC family protein n=1 Tax=Pseudolabrys sp. FHR47 TaxID=2562284 RepID=UPI0010BF606D|nr:VOC family protein [Pseudolabrys sp. FHR47]